jgi:hypothetical protein
MSAQPGVPGGTDPYAGGGQPDEEQTQAMLAQMRVTPVDQHLAQVLQLLLEGVQVKIGRNDGRLLLDATSTFVEHVRPYADANLIQQVDEALGQLRMAQVQAEAELQRAAIEEGHAEINDLPTPPRGFGQAPEPSDVDGADDGDGISAGASTPQPPAAPAAPGARLWTPGR